MDEQPTRMEENSRIDRMVEKQIEHNKRSKYIAKMIGQDQTVLLGTGLTTLGKAWQYDLSNYQKAATKDLSVADCQRLLHQSRVFWDSPQR